MPLTVLYIVVALAIAGLVGNLVARRRGRLTGILTGLGILLFLGLAYVILIQLLVAIAFENM